MTTPYRQGSGFINNLLGGVAGTLAGTNPLQSSLDQLTNAVNRLSSQMGSSSPANNGNNQNRQNNNASPPGRFPRPYNPFQPPGGGPAGNISQPTPFNRIGMGMVGGYALGSAFAGYGQQQMPFQIGLNQYAANSMMGMSNAGMPTFSSNFKALSNQPGMPMTSSSADYLQMMQSLSFTAGAPRYMSTSLGRAGFGAASAFGMTNPALSGAASANLAQQIYNPMLSMRMRLLGYNMTPRVMGSGMPQSIGNISASLLQGWYGKDKIAPSQLYKTLSMGGKGFTNLQYLGLNPQQMAPMLEGFNQLFNAGYTPQQASTLFANASSNNPNVAKKAQATLAAHHVTSVTSDIQKIKNNQSQVTQRSVNTAAGFDAALTQTTDDLLRFNSALNGLMTKLGLNGAVGVGGGFMGTLAGTNHGNMLLGMGGTALILRALMGGGGAASALGGLGAAGVGGLGFLGGIAGLGGIAAGGVALGKNTLSRGGVGQSLHTGNVFGNLLHGLSDFFQGKLFTTMTNGRSTTQNTGGGATTAPHAASSQSSSSRKNPVGGGVSGAAVKAVGAAESQLGVPYVWGGEMPGVGFDCSGLIQWAYKQAGVNLPRTSQQQWASLRKRSIPTNQAREGDLVFMAGSDGTSNSPGHVGMMVNNRSVIEAPTTGQNVKIIGFDPKQWSHAARPSGGIGSVSGMASTPGNNTGTSSLGLYGNAGIGMGLGNYGSVNESDIIGATGGFMGSGGGAFSAGGLGGLMSTKTNGGSTMGSASRMGNGSKNTNAVKAFAMSLLRAHGWSSQFGALNSLIMGESGWRWNATNPTSGAYGIPQALPASKMASAGKDWKTNPDTQLRWMIDQYIPKTYGSPKNAWDMWQSRSPHWYGGGGVQNGPGLSIVGDRGPELMMSTGGGNLIFNNAQTMSMLKSISQPQQSPWKNLTNQGQSGGQVIYPGISTGAKVNVTFGKNSIVVNVSATTDAQTAGQTLASQIISALQNEQLWNAVAKGQKN